MDSFDIFLLQQTRRVETALADHEEHIAARQAILRTKQRSEALQEMDVSLKLGSIVGTSAMGRRRPTLSYLDGDDRSNR